MQTSKLILMNLGVSINEQIILTTIKILEETVIKEQSVRAENEEPIKGDEKKSVTEEYDILPL